MSYTDKDGRIYIGGKLVNGQHKVLTVVDYDPTTGEPVAVLHGDDVFYVIKRATTRLRPGENRYPVWVTAEIRDPEVTASDLAAWLHDQAQDTIEALDLDRDDDVRFVVTDVSAS